MPRSPFLLTASIVEGLRFLLLGALSETLGLRVGEGGIASFALRYAYAPQLLYAAAFFFLWRDTARYAVYRPLLLLGKVLGVTALVPLTLSFSRAMGESFLSQPGLFLVVGGALLVLEGFSVAVLLGMSRLVRGGVSASGDPAAPAAPGPRGPDDIERVEV